MPRTPSPTVCFAVVIVKQGRRLLLVRERKHGQGWYFPAGKVDAGETFQEAALRETREESGIDVVLEGLLRIEHSPGDGATSGVQRLRVFFLARPADDATPKSAADDHSLGARFVAIEEIDALKLRHPEVATWFRAVLDGVAVAPLSLLKLERG